MTVTAEQLRMAATMTGVQSIDHHKCSICNTMTHYLIRGDEIFFDASCNCSVGVGWQRRTWNDAADWVNMQKDVATQMEIAELFGLKIGATGEFPDGKLTPQDEGAIQVAVISEKGAVRINFGKPITWLGMPAKDAIGFASLVIKHAIEAANASGEVLPIEIMELPIRVVNET